MSLLDVGSVIFGGTPAIIAFSRANGLLSRQKTCPLPCGTIMREVPRRDVTDDVLWWCPWCKRRKSIRKNSFFAKSRLPLQKWLVIINQWTWEAPVSQACQGGQTDNN